MNKAPWPDFDGNDIYEGDVIEHPSGERGTVIVVRDDVDKAKNYEWKVDYGDGFILWLGLQIGDKGQAVVVHNTNKSMKQAQVGEDALNLHLGCHRETMSKIYKYMFCNGNKYPEHLGASGDICGYVVYRDIAPRCEDKELVARVHKVAVFIEEDGASDYCDYRNEMMQIHGSDDITMIKRPN